LCCERKGWKGQITNQGGIEYRWKDQTGDIMKRRENQYENDKKKEKEKGETWWLSEEGEVQIGPRFGPA